jgi:hypothetical protein
MRGGSQTIGMTDAEIVDLRKKQILEAILANKKQYRKYFAKLTTMLLDVNLTSVKLGLEAISIGLREGNIKNAIEMAKEIEKL